MDATTWWYLKGEIDRRKRSRIKKSRRGWRCIECGESYSRYTPKCVTCDKRKKASRARLDRKRREGK